ncbi:MAG: ABC transporter substrate-binding protein [Alphaproteobacteria bacterium]|nr:ABC transporter substrate-binding protein [Alphaproteobacteria bacterium]
MKPTRCLGALCALAMVAAPAAAETPVRGGTLIYAVNGDTSTYDCHAASSFSNIHYLAPHFSLLLRFDAETYPRIVGDVAESWTLSEDGLAYTFRLRDGVLFHDGSKLTSRDVHATYERLRNPPPGVVSVRQGLFEDITAIETPDERTIVFRIGRPNAGMLSNFASPWNCLYSAAKLAADPSFPARNILGTGPFRFVEHVAGSHWIGKRFENYFDKSLPYLDGFRAVTMTNTAIVNSMSGGQIMAEFRGFSPSEVARVKSSRGDQVNFSEGGWLAHFFFSFNTQKKPFDDIRVRKALTLAVDRWGGAGPMSRITFLKTVGGLMRPGSAMALNGEDLVDLPGFSRDIAASRAEARRLLAEAGVPNLSFKLTNRVTVPFVPLGLFLIDQWRQIGVTVEHAQLETGQWLAVRQSGNYEVCVDSQAEWNDDPSVQLGRYVSFDRTENNISRYVDRTVDELYARQKEALDLKERTRLVHDIQRHLVAQVYSAPGLWAARNAAVDRKVRGWVALPSHMLNQDLREIWLKP